MNTNVVLVGLVSLSLGATCLVVARMPSAPPDTADLERRLAAAEKRADAVEALRDDVRALRDRLDRRITDVATRVESATVRAASPSPFESAAAPPIDGAPERAVSIEDAIAERVEKRVAEKIDTLAARDRQRGDDGKWKAPLEDLAKELTLDEATTAEVKQVFDRSRDEAFALLKTMRLDGGSLIDDFADALKSGADPGEETRSFFQRIVSERVPGSDRTYLAEFIAITQGVEAELGRRLDADRMKRLRALRVDLLDVKTGYDPVGDYVRAKLQ
jgi:hypothetical protein